MLWQTGIFLARQNALAHSRRETNLPADPVLISARPGRLGKALGSRRIGVVVPLGASILGLMVFSVVPGYSEERPLLSAYRVSASDRPESGPGQTAAGEGQPMAQAGLCRFRIPILSLWVLLGVRPEGAEVAQSRIPIVYSTDLYHPHEDPDDHFDLATLFALEEFDLRGIILDGGRRQMDSPGKIPLEQMLWLTGRQVPWAVGLADRLKHPHDDGRGQPEEFQAGVRLLVEVLEKSHRPVVLFTTGSLRDVAAAYLRRPELLRQKVSRLYINIGDAFGGPEYNVQLDPVAFQVVVGGDLPVYRCPCFAGGLWKREKGVATFWRFRQAEVLEEAPQPVQNWFLYALRREKAPPFDYLIIRQPEEHYRWLLGLDRNMWCTAPLLHAAGRVVMELQPGRFVALSAERARGLLATRPAGENYPRILEPFCFRPRVVRQMPGGQFSLIEGESLSAPAERKLECFEILEPERYDSIMTSVLRELLKNFPLDPRFRSTDKTP